MTNLMKFLFVPQIARTALRVRSASTKPATTSSTSTSTTTKSPSTSAQPRSRTEQRHNSSSTTGETNEPIAFFGSGAATFSARQGQSGGRDEHLWYQPLVISGSLAVFLIYFCILREENDIDQKLEGSLFDHVAGLEETQLMLSYNYNKEHGLSTEALEQRMVELEQAKQS